MQGVPVKNTLTSSTLLPFSHQILLFDADVPCPITYRKTDLKKILQAITEACGVSPSLILGFACPFRMIVFHSKSHFTS